MSCILILNSYADPPPPLSEILYPPLIFRVKRSRCRRYVGLTNQNPEYSMHDVGAKQKFGEG